MNHIFECIVCFKKLKYQCYINIIQKNEQNRTKSPFMDRS